MPPTADEKLEQILRRTSALIRRVDAGAAFLSVTAAAVFLLLGGILLDHHWTEGLSEKGRGCYALVSVLILVGFSCWRFYPLVRYKVNPLYAAWKLENAHPNLKNGLLNWFLMRGGHSVFERTLSRKTAEAISPHAESESVEMKPLVRAAMVFIASMTLLALNLVTSEKSSFVSAARVLFPTAQIAAPQRVTFRAVEPGNVTCNPGEQVTIKAEFTDSPGGEVFLLYQTVDGRTGEERLPMEETGYHTYSLLFPGSDEGLTEDILYRVAVIDGEKVLAASASCRITVLPPILLTPIRVFYSYPSYTGLPPETREGEGTIRAWEGTEIVVTARCTRPMSEAYFLPDGDLRLAQKMAISSEDPSLAEFSFTLGAETWSSYRLRCVDTGRNANSANEADLLETPSWEIQTRPDPAPVAAWEGSVPEQTNVAEGGTVPLRFTASDESFGLDAVGLEVVWWLKSRPAEKKTVSIDLTSQLNRLGVDRRGALSVSADFSPAANGIPPRAAAECRGYAIDNRPNDPNRSETTIVTLNVTENEQGSESPENEDPQGENGAGGNSNGGDSGKNEKGDGDPQQGNEQSESDSPPPGPQDQGDSGNEDNAEGTGESSQPASEGGESRNHTEAGGEPGESSEHSGADSEKPAETGRENGTVSDDSSEEAPSSSSSAGSGREGGDGDTPGNAPIDPESDPADAFDAILDFSGLDVESAPSEAEPQGKGTGISSPETEKKDADVPDDELGKIRSGPGSTPAGGERRTDSGNSELSADMQRETGAVDPASQNYMATEGNAGGEAPVPQGARVKTDPLLNPQQTEDTPPAGGEGEPAEGNAPDGMAENDAGNQTEHSGSSGLEGEPNGDSPGRSPAQPGEESSMPGAPFSGGTGSAAGEDRQREAAAADRANLQYTEKATNLVLSYLDEQLQQGADPRLLERLGWSEEELRLFHERWTEMKRQAKTSPAARRRYEEELHDMGLRPQGGNGVSVSGRSAGEKSSAAARSVLRVPPPPAYRDRLREYNRILSGAGETP